MGRPKADPVKFIKCDLVFDIIRAESTSAQGRCALLLGLAAMPWERARQLVDAAKILKSMPDAHQGLPILGS